MSFIARAWQRLTKPRYFVGTDLQGNKFFELPSSSDDPRRTKRRVQYKVYTDMWHYIGGGRQLPVQWQAWLSHTRPDPPTLTELQADLIRQQRVLHNVSLIEAREREEKARIVQANAAAMLQLPGSSTRKTASGPEQPEAISSEPAFTQETGRKSSTSAPISSRAAPETRPIQDLPPTSSPSTQRSELPRPARDEKWQPESWSPQAIRRRG